MKITTSRYALIFDAGISFTLFSNASKDTWNNPKHAAATVTRTMLCNPLLRARALWHRSCSVRAVIRKYRFWCFVNSESGRTRLSCRDSETAVIERLPSDNLLLSLILVDGINASPSAKTGMGSHHLSTRQPFRRLRGGQRTWWSSVNVRWSADINFPKHFDEREQKCF